MVIITDGICGFVQKFQLHGEFYFFFLNLNVVILHRL